MTQNRQMVIDLVKLIIQLNDEESESPLVDELQNAVQLMSFLDAGRGMEILSVILSGGVK